MANTNPIHSNLSDGSASSNATQIDSDGSEGSVTSTSENDLNLTTRKRLHSPSQETSTKRTRHNTSVAIGFDEEIQIQQSSSIEKMKSIDELPAEMLAAVLGKVTTEDLVNCRKVNRTWNEIASRIMRRRSDIWLGFRDTLVLKYLAANGDYENNYRKFTGRVTHFVRSHTSLRHLVDCLKLSTNFPVTSFRFDDVSRLGRKEMADFWTVWGENVFALDVHLDDPPNGILRDFLGNVPNLKKIKIHFRKNGYNDRALLPLPDREISDLKEFHLPKVETLCVANHNNKYRGIVENILRAACNLKSFDNYSFYRNTGYTIAHLGMLHSVNKLHCLKYLNAVLRKDAIVALGKSAKSLNLKLEALAVMFNSDDEFWDEQEKSMATTVIGELLHSSKDVIQTLTIEPIGWLPGLTVPGLEKLRKLTLYGYNEPKLAVFPPLCEMADVFPNLKELEMINISCNGAHFPQAIKTMPTVEILRIQDDTSPQSKETLMKATPNVTVLFMADEDYYPGIDVLNGYPMKDFRVVANNLLKLEHFTWHILKSNSRELFEKLDEVVTGFPANFCNKMAEEFRNRDLLTEDEHKLFQAKQRSSSILNLKELKTLDVQFFINLDEYYELKEKYDDEKDAAGFDRDSPFYKTGFTKVSKFLAFDLMRNLKVRIVNNYLDWD